MNTEKIWCHWSEIKTCPKTTFSQTQKYWQRCRFRLMQKKIVKTLKNNFLPGFALYPRKFYVCNFQSFNISNLPFSTPVKVLILQRLINVSGSMTYTNRTTSQLALIVINFDSWLNLLESLTQFKISFLSCSNIYPNM